MTAFWKTLLLTLLLCALASAASNGILAGGSPQGHELSEASDTLTSPPSEGFASSGVQRVSTDPRTGKVRFVGFDPFQPFEVPQAGLAAASLSSIDNPEQAARGFIAANAQQFGVSDQSDLSVMREKNVDGRSFVRFQQRHQGIPVLGGEMIVQTDSRNRILSATSKISPDIAVDTTPTVSAGEAESTAVTQIAEYYDLEQDLLQATTPELWIYDPVMLGWGQGPKQLVWRMDVHATEFAPTDELVLVDARTGDITLHFTQIETIKNRTIYDHNNVEKSPVPVIGDLKRSEGDGASGITDVDKAYEYFGDVYDFYSIYHGRDSINASGMGIIGVTRSCPTGSGSSCPMANAYWTSTYQKMYFGVNYTWALDVVGHEMTHGVTSYESGFYYYMQSGAMSESFSDIFGEFAEIYTGKSGAAGRWLLGENLSIGAVRDMSNPPAYGDPDKMTSANYVCGTGDNGGVHTNCGVGNKAAYLITDGGSFNGYTVTGLGVNKTARLFYEAQTNLLTSGSDYQDLYDALIQAAINLGFSSDDRLQVAKAVNATEMNKQPTSCAATDVPLCYSGKPATLFYDNMENTSSGNWDEYYTGTYGWFYYNIYATSGQSHLWGYDNYGLASYSYVYMLKNVTLPAATTPYMHFKQAYDFDSTLGYCNNAGVIGYTTNGGATWYDANSMIINNSYNDLVKVFGNNPIGGGSPAYCYYTSGYLSTKLNLSSIAGYNARFLFEMGSDSTSSSSTAGRGWFIDDVRVYTCNTNVCNGAGISGSGWNVNTYTNCTNTDVQVRSGTSQGFLSISGGNMLNLTSSSVYVNNTVIFSDGLLKLGGESDLQFT
ncbi:MAG: M4 family metallopeptidase [Candidatus Altiarchaeota archaeon]|nr:M4 family metallopeptidase [Candidatus Altiarchaeota archaeon]